MVNPPAVMVWPTSVTVSPPRNLCAAGYRCTKSDSQSTSINGQSTSSDGLPTSVTVSPVYRNLCAAGYRCTKSDSQSTSITGQSTSSDGLPASVTAVRLESLRRRLSMYHQEVTSTSINGQPYQQ
jgi:hypothetical protein